MPKKCVTFVKGFLIPNLNSGGFGDLLKWLDKDNKIFQIQWCHKSGPNWTEHEAKVFSEWDKYKGHYEPNDKDYFTKSKQRFRALLYKLTSERQLKKLKSSDKNVKIYCIGQPKQKKRISSSSDISSESSDYNFTVNEQSHTEEIYSFSTEMNSRNMPKKPVNVFEDHTYSCVDVQQISSDNNVGNIEFDCNNIPHLDVSIYEVAEELLSRGDYTEKMNFSIPSDQNLLQYTLENSLLEDEKENTYSVSCIDMSDEELCDNILSEMLLMCSNKDLIVRNPDVLSISVPENGSKDSLETTLNF